MTRVTFGSDGSYTIPDDEINKVLLVCNGQDGDDKSAPGGSGGYAEGYLSVTSGDTVYARFLDGGNGIATDDDGFASASGGDGGDAAEVRHPTSDSSDWVATAGGGGGGGDAEAYSAEGSNTADSGSGGDGGDTGQDGSSASAVDTSASGGNGEGETTLTGSDGETARVLDNGPDEASASGGGGGGGRTGGSGGGANASADFDNYANASAGGGGGGGGATSGVSSANTVIGGTQDAGGQVVIEHATPVTDLAGVDDGSASIILSWSDVPDDAGYNIYRSQATGTTLSDYTQIDSVSTDTTSYTDTGLENGELYYYRIETTRSDGLTARSNEANATTTVPAPQITSITETATGELTIEWSRNDSSPDGEWQLYRSTDGSLGSQIYSTTDLTAGSYTDTGLSSDQTYYYTIRRQTDHASADDQDAGGTVIPPSNIQTSVNGDDIAVTWDDNSSTEDGYRVYWRRSGSSTWDNVSADLAANTESFTITGLLDGEQYDVIVEVFVGSTTKRPLREV